MTKEQAQEEYLKLLEKKNSEAEKIIEKAKENGTWKQGLDANKDLFIELDKTYNEKIKVLKSLIDKDQKHFANMQGAFLMLKHRA